MIEKVGAFHMPCLAHNVDLIAKKFLADSEADIQFDEDTPRLIC